MGMKIGFIEENQMVTFDEDVHILGNIGKNAKVIMRGQNLTVDGDIQENVSIQTNHPYRPTRVVVKGSIGQNAQLDISGQVVVQGDIQESASLKIRHGLRVGGDIHDKVNIEFHNQVKSPTVIVHFPFWQEGVQLNSLFKIEMHVQGNIRNNVKITGNDINYRVYGAIGNECSLFTADGNIHFAEAAPSASIIAEQGDVYKGGVKLDKEQKPTFSIQPQ